MAKFRQVHIDFWQDGFVLDLTPEEKYFYLYLMTNSKTSQCGIYELPKRIIEIETGYNRETVDKLLNRFEQYGKVSYNEITKEIMLINWIKYNWINSPKVLPVIDKELKSIKNKDFVLQFLILCCEFGYGIDTLSILKEYPIDRPSIDSGEEREREREEEKEREEEINTPHRKSKIYEENSIHYKLALRLYENILKNNPDHKEPNLQKWADDVRLMLEMDKRPPDKIAYLIDWCQQDSFWKGNILSIKKLREKYDQLVIRVKEQIAKNNNHRDESHVPRAYQSLQEWADDE